MMSEENQTERPGGSKQTSRLAKWGLPSAISIAAIVYLARIIDFASFRDLLTARAATILLAALIVYGVWSLLFDALTLHRLMHGSHGDFTLVTAARVKAASYLLALVHYTLGAATLALLVRRRAGVGLAHAAGIVMMIMMFDLGIVLSMVAVGATLVSETEVELQLGLIAVVIAVIAGGLSLLRAPFSLGPLDRIRDLELFHTARTVPARDLVELAMLRLAFVMGFEMMGWAALYAFDIVVPFGALLVNFSGVVLVAMLPAIAGIGPTQIAMVEFFKLYGTQESLLACSVAMSAGLIAMRALIGIVFAREFSREAYIAVRDSEASTEEEA
jgi:hypothetical protein